MKARPGAPAAAQQSCCQSASRPWTRDDCLLHHHISADQFYCVRCHTHWPSSGPTRHAGHGNPLYSAREGLHRPGSIAATALAGTPDARLATIAETRTLKGSTVQTASRGRLPGMS